MNEDNKPIYACFFGNGELVGFTNTAEDACDWATAVNANGKSVRIVKTYKIKTDPHYQMLIVEKK